MKFYSPINLEEVKYRTDFKFIYKEDTKMTINGINGTNAQAGPMGMYQATDSYSRNIQNQIANAQKQLQELSSNEDMTVEEKIKKRQEIQQQIRDLNMQLRQHQTEQRREKQQAKGSSMDDMFGGTRNAGNTKAESKSTGFSQASMTAIISADSSIKQAEIQGSVATSMEGKAGVLKSEIAHNHGGNVEQKKEELADVEQKAQAATVSQMSALADAKKTMEKTAQADSTPEIGTKEEKAQDNMAQTDAQTENTENVQTKNGTYVDVRL